MKLLIIKYKWSNNKHEKNCYLEIKFICNGTQKVIQDFEGNDSESQDLKIFKMKLCLLEIFN